MSKETIFKDGAWVGGYEYSTPERLEDDIRKKEACVNCYKQKLLAMACATPSDVTPAGQDPLEHVSLLFNDLWDDLQEEIFSLSTMYTVQLNEDNINMGDEPE